KCSFFLDPSVSMAILAGIANDAALALAVRTSSHHAEKALLITRLARSAARDACFGRSSLFGTAAFTNLAFLKPRYMKLFVSTGRGVFERYFDIVAKVGTALESRTARRPPAKHVAKPEHVKDVFD